MHQITRFWPQKLKNLPILGGGHPLPHRPPARELRSLAFVTFPLGAPPPPPNALSAVDPRYATGQNIFIEIWIAIVITNEQFEGFE